MYERRHADSAPLSVEQVQALMRDGLLFRTAIDQRSATGVSSPTRSTAQRDKIPANTLLATASRTARLVEAMDLVDAPVYTLSATPHPTLPGRQMFEAADNALVRLLLRPHRLRHSGFDMDTGSAAEIVGGESRRSLVRGYKGKEFWHDGTLVFVGQGDEEFLSWGNRVEGQPLLINQVTLLESLLLFSRLAADLFTALGQTTSKVEFVLQLKRLCRDEMCPRLAPGPMRPHRRHLRTGQAPDCDFETRTTVSGSIVPGRISYELAALVYEWFGLENDQIPYVEDADGLQISEKQLAAT